MSAPAYNPRAGAIDALANFWLSKILCSDEGDAKVIAEYNLDGCADEALFHYLKRRNATTEAQTVEGTFSDGFTLGLQVAALLVERPWDAETSLRALLDELVAIIEWRRQDEAVMAVRAAELRGEGIRGACHIEAGVRS